MVRSFQLVIELRGLLQTKRFNGYLSGKGTTYWPITRVSLFSSDGAEKRVFIGKQSLGGKVRRATTIQMPGWGTFRGSGRR